MHKLIMAASIGVFAIAAPCAIAQNHEAKSPYAIEDCRSGCYLVKESDSDGNAVYIGAVPRTFRVCSADPFGGSLIVDGKTSVLPGTTHGVRSCRDVNGLNIVLVKGTLAVGALP